MRARVRLRHSKPLANLVYNTAVREKERVTESDREREQKITYFGDGECESYKIENFLTHAKWTSASTKTR